MTIIPIPNSLIDLHEFVSTKIMNSSIGNNCQLYYPPIKTDCPNCQFNPITKKSANIYVSGGPIAFSGGLCPYCNGEGFVYSESTETIRMKVYWNPKDWEDIGVDIQQSDGVIQTQAFVYDAPKIERCNYMIPVVKNEQTVIYKYKLLRKSIPHGFRQDKFFISFWERVK